jgi:hypothetical protein
MKRPRSTLLVIMFSAWLACAVRAHATATTHIWAPSTDVQPFGVWHVTDDVYLAVRKGHAGARIPSITNVGLTVGVLPFKQISMEIGIDHKSGFGPLDDYPMYGNVKIGVPEKALGGGSPAVAIGLFDIGTKRGRTDFNVVYGEVARTASFGAVSLGRFSAGYFVGTRDLLIDQNGGKDNAGLLAAWERTMVEISDKLWLCVEYMGTESLYGTLNVGGSWKFGGNVSVIGGYDIFNNHELVNSVTLQVDIDI